MEHARKSDRASVPLVPRYRLASSFEYVDGRCIDLSEGGMFIAADLPAEQGTLIKFECVVQGQAAAVKGVGRVVWRRSGAGPDRPSGMGLKFVKLEPGTAEVIAVLVHEAQANGKTAPQAPLPAQVRRTESYPAFEAVSVSGAHEFATPAQPEAPKPALVVAAAQVAPAPAPAPAAAAVSHAVQPAVSSPKAQPAAPVAAATASAASGGGAVWIALAAGAALLGWLLLR